MLHRLFAARGPNRTARFAGIFVLAIAVLAITSFVNTPSAEAAKGGNGKCPTCTTPTPTPAPTLSAPVFTAQTPSTTATVGAAYSYTFRASGNPTPTYAVYSGWLPPGLGLNWSTGLLSGTPTAAGSYSFRVSATNSVGTAVTATITITVGTTLSAPVFIAQTPPTTATVGTAYSYTFTASGNPAPSYAVYSGWLPSGLGLNATTGLLSGTPTTAGSYSFSISATNSAGTAVTATRTISVGTTLSAPVFIAQTPPTTATVGTGYSYTFTASGNPAPSYAVYSGWLPSGLGLNTTTGLLSGTPTTAGSYSFSVSATNSAGTAVTATSTITVASSCTAPWWGSVATSYNMTAGTWSSYSFSASGSPTPTHALYSGSIPAGMSLSSTGVVSGTPTTAGSYSFQLSASNSCGTALSPAVTMSVTTATVAPLAIQAFPYPFTFDSGQAVSYQFVATGGTQPYIFRWSTGIMPAGLALSQSGLLSGTILAAPNQDFTFMLGVTDAKGTTKAAMVWIHIR